MTERRLGQHGNEFLPSSTNYRVIPPGLDLSNIRNLRNMNLERVFHGAQEQIDLWSQYNKVIDHASTIAVIGHLDGLGDRPHHYRYAEGFAKKYPNKAVIFLTDIAQLFDVQATPKNLQIINKDDPNNNSLLMSYFVNGQIVFFNPSMYSIISNMHINGKEASGNINIINKDPVENNLWSLWQHLFSDNRRIPLHQIQAQLSKMNILFGMDIPPYKDFPVIPIITPSGNSQDIVIINDAFHGARTKMLAPDQWREAILNILQQKPESKITLVRGTVHPDEPDLILSAIPVYLRDKIQVVEFKGANALVKLIGDCLSAKLIITVDTGPGHLVNEAIRRLEAQGSPHPQILSLMGDKSIFNPYFFRLDRARTLLTEENVPLSNLLPEDIANHAIDMLQM